MSKGSILTVISLIIFLYIVSNKLFINKKLVLAPLSYSKFINFICMQALPYSLRNNVIPPITREDLSESSHS